VLDTLDAVPPALLTASAYYFGLHLLGAIGLVGWILNCEPKYVEHLKEFAQDRIWWYVHAAQTAGV
jgi:hypothetical protein